MKTRNQRELQKFWNEQATKKAKLAKHNAATQAQDQKPADAPAGKQVKKQS